MAGSVNKVILVGNLGKDPEIRSTQDGRKIANFTMATSETWNDRASGERKEKTEWHRVVSFNDNINTFVEKFLKKGAKVYVEGALTTRKWTDQAGVEKYTTEVVITQFKGELTSLDSRNDGGGGGDYAPRERAAPAGRAPASRGAAAPSWDQPKPGGDLDDDIPF